MGLPLSYVGTPVCMAQPPRTEELLALGLKGAALSLEDFQSLPGHVTVDPPGRHSSNLRGRAPTRAL
jgi:hypothetical protein